MTEQAKEIEFEVRVPIDADELKNISLQAREIAGELHVLNENKAEVMKLIKGHMETQNQILVDIQELKRTVRVSGAWYADFEKNVKELVYHYKNKDYIHETTELTAYDRQLKTDGITTVPGKK